MSNVVTLNVKRKLFETENDLVVFLALGDSKVWLEERTRAYTEYPPNNVTPFKK